MAQAKQSKESLAKWPQFPCIDHLSHLTAIEKSRYDQKIKEMDICDPYSAPVQLFSCLKTTETLPDLEFGDIWIYLVNGPSSYTAQEMKAYKATDSHKYAVSGWVNHPIIWTLDKKDRQRFHVIKARVNHSYELTTRQTTTWVAVQDEGMVMFGHCDCMAGLGEVFSHVGAVLYDTLAAVTKLKGKTCTDKSCYWNEPSMGSVRNVDYAEGSDIQFTKRQRKNHRDKNHPSGTVINAPSDTERASLFEALMKTEAKDKCAILAIVPGHSQRYVPRTITLNLPPSLGTLYDPASTKWSRPELMACSTLIYDNLVITQEQSNNIEEETRSQFKCRLWYDYRSGRVTASKFREAARTKPMMPSKSLIKRTCYPNAFRITSESTSHGIEHEDTAREAYKEKMGHHSNMRVDDCGLFINPTMPWIGASPDGMLSCSCHGKGLLEIKCPSLLIKETFATLCSRSTFCLEKGEDGTMSLKRDHQYYYQVQAQIHVVEAEYCDFVVWSPKEPVHIERIYPDTEKFESSLQHVKQFIRLCIIPELVGKVFTVPRAEEVTPQSSSSTVAGIGCYCCEADDEDMLTCTSGRCLRIRFHKKCIRLQKVSKCWKCVDCTKIINKEKRDKKKNK